jgi:hypothetical protein
MESAQWLEFLHPFTSVGKLYLPNQLALRVRAILQGLSEERVTDVLPALRDLAFEVGPLKDVQERIEQFVAVRQISCHPTANHW